MGFAGLQGAAPDHMAEVVFHPVWGRGAFGRIGGEHRA